MKETKLAIMRDSALPMSIIIVEIDNKKFLGMDELDSDEKMLRVDSQVATRDIVQFVPFEKYKGVDAANSLAEEVLAEVP